MELRSAKHVAPLWLRFWVIVAQWSHEVHGGPVKLRHRLPIPSQCRVSPASTAVSLDYRPHPLFASYQTPISVVDTISVGLIRGDAD